MHITPYKAMYFPNFIFLRKRLKSSHTSLKKLEKEDFNSINRYFISSLVPASAFVSQGSMPWLTNTWISILQVLPIWGIEPQVGNADAGTRRPQVRTRPPIRQTNYSLLYVLHGVFLKGVQYGWEVTFTRVGQQCNDGLTFIFRLLS